MLWWQWLIFGLFLIVLEIFTPGLFIALFFGLAALVIATLSAISPSLPIWLQWLLFALASCLLLFVLRPYLQHQSAPTGGIEPDLVEGTTARAKLPIPAGEEGRVEFRGTTWRAHNTGSTDIVADKDCLVITRKGLLLEVQALTTIKAARQQE